MKTAYYKVQNAYYLIIATLICPRLANFLPSNILVDLIKYMIGSGTGTKNIIISAITNELIC